MPELVRTVSYRALPPGYEITYHENRGYDSPSRWWEVTYRGEKLGLSKTTGFGSLEEAEQEVYEHDIKRFAVQLAMLERQRNEDPD